MKSSPDTSPLRMPLAALALLLALAALPACDDTEDHIDRADVSGIAVDTEIRRFERDLFAMDTADIATARARIDSQYGEFATLYFGRVIGADDPRIAPEGPEAYLRGFLGHAPTRRLYDTIQIVYPDLDDEKEHFDLAFRYLKHYFPERPQPRVTTFLSEFGIAGFVYGNDELAVGLDLLLGEDYPYAGIDPSNPMFSGYMVRTYNRDHLVPRTLKPLLEDIAGPPTGDRLIDRIIHNGKVLWLQDLLLPGIPDSAKYEFSPDQLEWCRDNERNVWAYFLREKLLYDTDFKKHRKYVEYSPHSPGMPPEAPGRTGDWMGLQIVRAWFREHPDASPADMLRVTDSQKFLEASKFKPRR